MWIYIQINISVYFFFFYTAYVQISNSYLPQPCSYVLLFISTWSLLCSLSALFCFLLCSSAFLYPKCCQWLILVHFFVYFWLYTPVCLQATVKASNIWSFVSYCWLFHYLCNSLCLSAQLCWSPRRASVQPPLPLRTTHLRCTFFLCPPFTYSHTHRIASSLSPYITPFFSFFLFFLAPYSLSTSSRSIYTDTIPPSGLQSLTVSHPLMPSPSSPPTTSFLCISVIIRISFLSALSAT